MVHQSIASVTTFIVAIVCLQCAFHAAAFCVPHTSCTTTRSTPCTNDPSSSLSTRTVAISAMFDGAGEDENGTEGVTAGDEFEDYTPGQKTLASKDTMKGSGESSKDGDVLTVNYRGQVLKSGKVFDEGTFTFKLGERKVIPGWDLGLKDMQVGGKRTLKIPPTLAYGSRGAGDVIPPNADLMFECELIKLGNGPGAEAMIAVDGIVNKLKSPRGAILAFLFTASFLLPKDLKVGDMFDGLKM